MNAAPVSTCPWCKATGTREPCLCGTGFTCLASEHTATCPNCDGRGVWMDEPCDEDGAHTRDIPAGVTEP